MRQSLYEQAAPDDADGGRAQAATNLRTSPFVLDPFGIKDIDAVLAITIMLTISTSTWRLPCCKTVGSTQLFALKACVDLWLRWGVPAERCVVARVGDEIPVGDIVIQVLDAFDRTALVTLPAGVSSTDKSILDGMDRSGR